MSRPERDEILKLGLLLVILEGWTSMLSARSRLGSDVEPAARWLWQHGYVQSSDDGATLRWVIEREFESLWDELIPERGCPVTLCKSVRARGTLGSGCDKPVAH